MYGWGGPLNTAPVKICIMSVVAFSDVIQVTSAEADVQTIHCVSVQSGSTEFERCLPITEGLINSLDQFFGA